MFVSKRIFTRRRAVLLTLVATIAVTSIALAGDHEMQKDMAMKDKMAMKKMDATEEMKHAPQLGLEGYCPVCIIKARKWERGLETIQSIYDGKAYRFPSEQMKAVFEASPTKFVPALGGDCTVCYARSGKRMPGNIRHAALYRGRLFLFPGDGEKQAFTEDPTSYANIDLAAMGDCVVS